MPQGQAAESRGQGEGLGHPIGVGQARKTGGNWFWRGKENLGHPSLTGVRQSVWID